MVTIGYGHTALIVALGKQRQEDQEFKASLGYMHVETLCQKNKMLLDHINAIAIRFC